MFVCGAGVVISLAEDVAGLVGVGLVAGTGPRFRGPVDVLNWKTGSNRRVQNNSPCVDFTDISFRLGEPSGVEQSYSEDVSSSGVVVD